MYNVFVNNKVAKVLLMLLFPLYFLFKFFPKNKRVVIFGSASGFAFSDNSKYLFLEFSQNDALTSVWITKNKVLFYEMKKRNYKVCMSLSLSGIFYQLVAKYCFVSYGVNDLCPLFLGGVKKIFLWHGVPLKKIGPEVDLKFATGLHKNLHNLVYQLFPYIYYMNADYVVNPVKQLNDRYIRAFSKTSPKIINVAQPRVNFLSEQTENNDNMHALRKKYHQIIVWMPTHRLKAMHSFSKSLCCNIKAIKAINESLKRRNSIMFIKPHPLELYQLENSLSLYSNIKLYADFDPYPLLKITDTLITDYSSVAYDFFVKSSRVLFFCYDYQDYYDKSEVYNAVDKEFLGASIVTSWQTFEQQLTNDNAFESIGFSCSYQNKCSVKKITTTNFIHLFS